MKGKREYMLCLLLHLVFFFVGCGDVGSQFDNDPKGNFDALWTIIDRNYCFFEYKDIDWDGVYKEYSPRITPDMDNEGLFKLLGLMLAELKDGHVNLSASHDVARYWKWHEDYPSNFDQAIQKHYLGSDFYISSGMRYKIFDDNTGYLYYGSFSNDVGEGNLDHVLNTLAICRGLIIDVRGNGGGSLLNVERIASRFFNERRLVGYISHKEGPQHDNFSDLYPKYVESSNRVRYQKPVIVLTNRECYSATNEFVSVMKYAPNVVVMGDKTGGGSGLPFSSELPNGWSVRFSASPMYNAEKEHIEFGVEPDVYVGMLDEDRRNNKDTIIERARALLKDTDRLNDMLK